MKRETKNLDGGKWLDARQTYSTAGRTDDKLFSTRLGYRTPTGTNLIMHE